MREIQLRDKELNVISRSSRRRGRPWKKPRDSSRISRSGDVIEPSSLVRSRASSCSLQLNIAKIKGVIEHIGRCLAPYW
ncbi:hypothetical protein Nepgr_016735 [Nepenthes gracilis]|uniref:Uncharacterized protein n=1 Tax=Nepenthes gracilis TaxID=150966 RepID=A0AAD3XSE6_NEPGR|nr:hypothetical protein Nepgr_016735 [Nepenthes gracilis]